MASVVDCSLNESATSSIDLDDEELSEAGHRDVHVIDYRLSTSRQA